MKEKKYFILIILIFAFIFNNANAYIYALDSSGDDTDGENKADFIYDGENLYIKLKTAVISEGYYLFDDIDQNIMYKKNKIKNQPEIIIKFDLKNKTANKNEFRFDINNKVKLINGEIYIEKEKLKEILNINIKIEKNSVKFSPLVFAPDEWVTMGNGLVAHAGGCVNPTTNPPNCRQAVIYSYNHGHKIFELDFNLTTDGKLAVVHDWDGYVGMKSSEEWKEIKIWGVYTAMILEDVLDIMLVNKDMFLITDTKSFEYTQEQIKEQFEILIKTAKEKDPTLGLLNRIIPQIYNQPMYDIIMAKYNFKSVIYTLYASRETNKEVLDFIQKHDNIHVVTMAPPKNTGKFVEDIRKTGRYVYLHTFNELQEILDYKKAGIWGIYTDFVFPSEITPEAVPIFSKVTVDGKEIDFDAYNINGNNYFKLRDLAYILNGTAKQFNVGWNEITKTIILTSNKKYTIVGSEMSGKGENNKTAVLTISKIYLDGREINPVAYNIDGNNYFKLRDIGQIFDFYIGWNEKQNTIIIDTGKKYFGK